MNLLKDEKSLYLRQHASNPVDWYPWTEQAFEKARKENRLIFLSIGYSSCHWCHVMEKECFEDPRVAELLNRSFVSIKVDREERPDVDDVFMTVCQAMTGRGGWPLSIFLTPEGRPFFSATYIPKSGRHGMPGMLQLLPRLSELWREKPEIITAEAERIYQALKETASSRHGTPLDRDLPGQLIALLRQDFDRQYGGFGSSPKFPMAVNLLFLLEWLQRSDDREISEFLKNTLSRMASGGIWDHVGGGFHRYSVDRHWRLPHFEKMLYDQALLLEVYSRAFSLFGSGLFREIAYGILDFLRAWLYSPLGTFYTAVDADVDGQEGGYYLWTKAQIKDILPEDVVDDFMRVFNIQEEGNYIDEATGKKTGMNVLYMIEPADKTEDIKEALRLLYAERKKRRPPATDTKMLTDLNGLMISSLCVAYDTFRDHAFITMATKAAEFFVRNIARQDTLGHCFYDDEAAAKGTLNDYASLCRAFLDLYGSTSKKEYLDTAERLTADALELFYDETEGLRLYQPEPFLIDIPVEPFDAVLPSGVSMMVENLFRLAGLTGNTEFKNRAWRVLNQKAERINRFPQQYIYIVKALLCVPPSP